MATTPHSAPTLGDLEVTKINQNFLFLKALKHANNDSCSYRPFCTPRESDRLTLDGRICRTLQRDVRQKGLRLSADELQFDWLLI